jgi:hypothetical protein
LCIDFGTAQRLIQPFRARRKEVWRGSVKKGGRALDQAFDDTGKPLGDNHAQPVYALVNRRFGKRSWSLTLRT